MKKTFVACYFICFQLISITFAESLFIPDASFDDIVIPDGTSSNLIYNPLASEYPVQAPHGENVCRIREGGGWENFNESPVEIPILHNLLTNSFYVLEVNVGQVWEVTDFEIQLWAGTNMLKSAKRNYVEGTSITPAGGFLTVRVPFNVPDDHPAIGSPLKICLNVSVAPYGADFVAHAHFDNIRLSRSAGLPKLSIGIQDNNNIQLHLSNLVTNMVYEVKMIDSLIVYDPKKTDPPHLGSIITNQSFFSADVTETNISMPIIGKQGFIFAEPVP